MSRKYWVCLVDGYEDIYQLWDKIIGGDKINNIVERGKICQQFEIREGKLVIKYQRKISALLMSELIHTLTQGGITKEPTYSNIP